MHNNINLAIQAAIEAGKAILSIYSKESIHIDYKGDQSPLTIADRTAHRIIEERLILSEMPVLSEEGREIPFQEREKWDEFWMVDPLDGTKEFIHRNGEFTVNIAWIKNQHPIAGIIYVPVTAELYVAVQGEGAFKISHPNESISFSEIKKTGQSLPFLKNDHIYRIVASRSHCNSQTEEFITQKQKIHLQTEVVQAGSSLKLCRVAENSADIYPRFGPTMEWDTAAGHAILKACGKNLVSVTAQTELSYNKPDLLNPFFIAE